MRKSRFKEEQTRLTSATGSQTILWVSKFTPSSSESVNRRCAGQKLRDRFVDIVQADRFGRRRVRLWSNLVRPEQCLL